MRGWIATVCAATALCGVTNVAAQSPSSVRVDAFTGTNSIQCLADHIEFTPSTSPVTFGFQCTSTGAYYACKLTTGAIYDLGIGYVIVNCNNLVLVPPPEVFMDGFEP